VAKPVETLYVGPALRSREKDGEGASMPRPIEYYFSCSSPWSYLGHAKFTAIAKKHALMIAYRLLPLPRLFPETGGLPLSKRHPVRQDYRLIELQRWRDKNGVDLKLRPKYWPFDPSLADRVIIALSALGRVEDFLPQALAAVFSSEQNLPRAMFSTGKCFGVRTDCPASTRRSRQAASPMPRMRDDFA